MDAFAAAVSKGLTMRKIDYRAAVLIALFFGAFQAGMPIAGYFAAVSFEKYVAAAAPWIAFALLALIGGKTIFEAVKEIREKKEEQEEFRLKWGELILLSVATSIDALAVGVSFALLNVPIWRPALIIGLTTLCLSFAGVLIGNRFGARFKTKAEIAGGIILILIGLRILLNHLGVISF